MKQPFHFKSAIIVTLLLILPNLAFRAQTLPDSLMNMKARNCEDIFYNASLLIPTYSNTGLEDKAWQVFSYWKESCNPSDIMTYVEAILQLKREGKITIVNQSAFIDRMLNAPIDEFESDQRGYSFNQKESKTDSKLYAFVSEKAVELMPKVSSGSLEEFVCLILSGERKRAIKLLEGSSLNETAAKKRYEERRKQLFHFEAMHLQLRAGAWIPQGNPAVLGTIPALGFTLGGSFQNGDLMHIALEGIVGSSLSDSVAINFRDSLIRTDFVSGIYIGLEYDKEVWRSRDSWHRIGIRLGAGYSHINLIPEEYRGSTNTNNTNNTNNSGSNSSNDNTPRPRKLVSSITGNIGISYHYNITPFAYVGASGRYNFTDYRNAKGTELRGPSFSATILFGFYLGSQNYDEGRKLAVRS